MRVRKFCLTSLGAALLALASLAGTHAQQRPAAADLKVRMKIGNSAAAGQGMEMTTYIKGQRMRSEMAGAGMGMANIMQCDLRRTISLNSATRTYMITPLDGEGGAPSAPGAAPAAGQQQQTRRGGVVNVTNTVTDTGERKEMFGFTARRIKTSMVREAAPDSCDPGNTRLETDGWYIDFQYDFACPAQQPAPYTPGVTTRPDCQDEVRTRTVGTAKLGYPVHVTTTVQRDGAPATTMTQEVLELARGPLDAALFDVPAGYTLAQSAQEMYGMGAAAAARAGGRDDDGAGDAAGPSSNAGGASGPAASAAGTPKKPGVVRVCQVMPRAQVTSGAAAQAAEAVRNTFASFLTGPTLEAASLGARLPEQAMAEARQSQCDYVLHVSLTQKKGGGGGMFGRALGNIAGAATGHIPGGNTAGEAAARSAAISGVYTTASIASSIKAKDEITLEYRLEAVDASRPALSKTEKAKAKSDGEDVLTPLVERAAAAVAAAASKQ